MNIFLKLDRYFRDEHRRRNYYLIYTGCFLAAALFCYSWFIVRGKSLIWQDDGWLQHFKALVYYGQYLRDILHHLIYDRELVIPAWDFTIGEGADVINTLHYYVIGDPIALLSVFVPTRYMHVFYSASCIFRLWLAGIVFSELCFGTGLKNRVAVLGGALSYSLCYWGLLCAARHPYFLNPLIYFPLLILSIEKILRKERPYLFILTAAVSAASNIYFFYMIALLAIVYALLRLALLYRHDLKKGVGMLLYMGVMALIGVCMAGVLLLPVIWMFLGDGRLSVPQPFFWLYPFAYYGTLPTMLVSPVFMFRLCLGLSAPTVLSVVLLFTRRKQDTLLKLLVGIGCLIILFPIGGRLLNGMSYMTNRWSWAFVLLCCYILVREWEALLSVSAKQWKILAAFTLILFLLVPLSGVPKFAASAYFALPLFLLTLFWLSKGVSKPRLASLSSLFLVLILVLGAVSNAFLKFSPLAGDYVSEIIDNSQVWKEWDNNEARTVRQLADSEYPRYTGRSLTLNAGMVNGVSSTNFYFSNSNPNVSAYRADMNMRESMFQRYLGYDDRTALIALAAVQYYTTKAGDSAGLPFGLELLTTEDGRDIYSNPCALPMGYTYDACVAEEDWDMLNAVQRQELQLHAATVYPVPDTIPRYAGDTASHEIPYTLKRGNKQITKTETGFITTAERTKLTLTLPEDMDAGELYVGFEGLDFTPTTKYDLYHGDDTVDPRKLYGESDWAQLSWKEKLSIWREKLCLDPFANVNITVASSSGVRKSLIYRPAGAAFTSGTHDFIVNLGYSDQPVTSVTITLSNRGVYKLENLRLYTVGMADFPETIAALRREPLENISFGPNRISGSVSASAPRILCVATPCSAGWHVAVDGKEQQLLRVNLHYLGVELPAGTHDVVFTYETPYQKTGALFSLLGMAGFLAIALITEQRRRRVSPAMDQNESFS